MLTLPLLRAVLDVPGNDSHAWQLDAHVAGGRLMVTLSAPAAAREDVAAALSRAELGRLHQRLALLHGDAARLWTAHTPPLLSLDLPLTFDAAPEDISESTAVRAAA